MAENDDVLLEAVRTLLRIVRAQHIQINGLMMISAKQDLVESASGATNAIEADNLMGKKVKQMVSDLDLIEHDQRSALLQSLLDKLSK
jgi:uncharacterized protein YbcI